MGKPVVFDEDDFRRMAKAVISEEISRRNVGVSGNIIPTGSSQTNAFVRCIAAYSEEAKGWPGVITYRYFASDSTPTDWVDTQDCYIEEVNGEDLEIGKRYECHVYGIKEWTNADDEDVASVFVLVDLGSGSGTSPPPPPASCVAAAGWTNRECLAAAVVSTSGICSDIDDTQKLTLTWDSGDANWQSGDNAVDDPEDDFVYDTGLGPMVFWQTGGQPHLSIDGIEGMYLGCVSSSLEFAFGTPLCSENVYGERVNCGNNTFVISISCECCAVPGYTTSGWYKVLPLGLTCADICSGACVQLTTLCEAGNWVICSGPYADNPGCLSPGECPSSPPPSGDWQCAALTATLAIGAATGSDSTLYQISPLLWQSSTGWILQSPGIDPNAGGSGDCSSSLWALYWGVVGTSDPTSCVHCSDGSVVTDPGPLLGCMILSDDSGGGVGPEGGSCASESYVCCDVMEKGESILDAIKAGKPLTVKTGIRKPCEYEGKILSGGERSTIGLGQSNKNWKLCLYGGKDGPTKNNGNPTVEVKNGTRVTCGCIGCGPQCNRYKAKEDEDED